MRYRQIRRIDTGQWLNVLFTVDGPTFSVQPESHLASIAAALGVPPSALAVVDSDVDLRTGTLLSLPPPPAPPPNQDLVDFDAGDAVTKLRILRRRVLEA